MFYLRIDLPRPNVISNAFGRHFASIFFDSNIGNIIETSVGYDCFSIDVIFLSESDMLDVFKQTKFYLTRKQDRIPSYLLDDCTPGFLFFISIIYNLGLQTAIFSDG